MTDWTTLPTGCDLSHHNGAIDWPRLASTGPAFVVLKATEGMGVDPRFDANRRGAADAKIPWLAYAYLRPSDRDPEIRHLLSVIGDPEIPVALDWEQRGVSASVVEAWIDAMPRRPWVYYGLYPPAPATPKIASCLRWFPQYPGTALSPPRLPPWDGVSEIYDWSRSWFVWQWSERGREPGISGSVDMDRLSCSIEVFRDWYGSGVLPMQKGTVPASSDRVLRLHSTGPDVKLLQLLLGVTPEDGVFGPATLAAVEAFQTNSAPPADGVVGSITWAALRGLKGPQS